MIQVATFVIAHPPLFVTKTYRLIKVVDSFRIFFRKNGLIYGKSKNLEKNYFITVQKIHLPEKV